MNELLENIKINKSLLKYLRPQTRYKIENQDFSAETIRRINDQLKNIQIAVLQLEELTK